MLFRVIEKHSISLLLHSLRSEPFNYPRAIDACVQNSIMQPTLSPLPEFYFCWLNSVTTPIRRFWQYGVVFKLSHYLANATFQFLSAFDHFALRRCPRTNLSVSGAAIEILLGGIFGD